MQFSETNGEGQKSAQSLIRRPLFYFDLEPVLDRAGPTMLRNPNRLEIVCSHCVRSLTPSDEIVFAKTGFFLVVTSCGEAQAVRLAQRISTVLLKCFFGEAEPRQDEVQAVFRRLAGAELSGFASLVNAARTALREQRAEPASPAVAPANSERPDPLVELAAHGIHRDEGFRFGFAPVHDLRRGTVSTFFCNVVRDGDTQAVSDRESFHSIGPRDLPRIDQAMLVRSLAFSKQLSDWGIVAAVSTCVSFETLAWSKGRQFYQDALRVANAELHPLLIVMIDMIPPGTPQMRIAELVAYVRPFARRVFVQLPADGFLVLESPNQGVAGYVLSARPGMTDVELAAQAMRFAKLCAFQNALTCVSNIIDLATLHRVRAAGIRFGEGSFFKSRFFFADTTPESFLAYRTEVQQIHAAMFRGEPPDLI